MNHQDWEKAEAERALEGDLAKLVQTHLYQAAQPRRVSGEDRRPEMLEELAAQDGPVRERRPRHTTTDPGVAVTASESVFDRWPERQPQNIASLIGHDDSVVFGKSIPLHGGLSETSTIALERLSAALEQDPIASDWPTADEVADIIAYATLFEEQFLQRTDLDEAADDESLDGEVIDERDDAELAPLDFADRAEVELTLAQREALQPGESPILDGRRVFSLEGAASRPPNNTGWDWDWPNRG